MTDDVLRQYETTAETLIGKFEAISSADLYAPVIEHLPRTPARILDIGAGTGRDAAWLTGLGHHVTAVEPVKAFRSAGQSLHTGIAAWVDDTLPDLKLLVQAEQTFDLILITAVWHHLDEAAQKASATTLSKLLVKGGRLILSIRHQAGIDPQVQTDHAIACLVNAGLACQFQTKAPSRQVDNQKAGVFWTWAVFGSVP